jgi:signal transduction histidine kinase
VADETLIALASPRGEGRAPAFNTSPNPLLAADASFLPIPTVELDRHGVIVSANAAWGRLARDHTGGEDSGGYHGARYLDIYRQIVWPWSDGVRAAEAGIQAVLAGRQASFTHEQPYGAPRESRTSLLHVVPHPARRGVLVFHFDTSQDPSQEMSQHRPSHAGPQLAPAQSVATAQDLEASFDAITAMVVVFDRRQRVLRLNAKAKAMLRLEGPVGRLSAADIISRIKLADLDGCPLDGQFWPLTRALTAGEAVTGADPSDHWTCQVRGVLRYMSISAAPIRDRRGAIVGASMVAHDVTAYHRAEQQKADILKTVAHDLGNPLCSVSLYVQTQLRQLEQGKPLRDPDPALLRTMEHALERADRLVKDLQAMARMESNGADYRIARCDLTSLCEREVEMHRLITGRDLRLLTPSRPIEVMADGDRIGEVLSNLLANAHKYSPADQPIVVRLRLSDRGRQARVSVHDRGPGIPKQERKLIWKRFYRVAGVRMAGNSAQSAGRRADELGGNLGLGLSICKDIVERHGGHIDVTSGPGRGSTFYFTLALADPTEAEATIQP